MTDDEQEIIETVPSLGSAATEVIVESGGDEEPTLVELPKDLPILPLKNTVLFPFMVSPLLVNTDRARKLIDDVLLTPKRLLVCVSVRGEVERDPGPDQLHRVGTVMRIARTVMVVNYLVMAALLATDVLTLWHLYAVIVIGGTAWTFDMAARRAMTPDLVDTRLLANAIALDVMVFTFMLMIGPIVAGAALIAVL